MIKRIAAIVFGLQFLSLAASATTTYKICNLPDAASVTDTDHFELSRSCAGSYNATAAELATFFLSKAPGSNGQLLYSSGNKFTAGSPSTIKALLGLSTVATSGNYGDLLNLPTIPSAQVNSDWSASSGVAQVLNKPSLGSLAALSSVNNTNWSGSALSIANGGTGANNQLGAQTALGVVPGTNVQSHSSALDTLASGATTVNGHPLTSSVSVTKSDVGLSNVENSALSTWPATVIQINSGSSNTIASFSTSRTTVAWNSSSGAAKTQNFPGCTAALSGYYLTIKDEFGDSVFNKITLTPSTGTVDGFSSITLSYINKPSITLECDGVSNWMGV